MLPKVDDFALRPGRDLVLNEANHVGPDRGEALAMQWRNQEAPIVSMRPSVHPDDPHAKTAGCRIPGTLGHDADGAPGRRVIEDLLIEGGAGCDDELTWALVQEPQVRELEKGSMDGMASQCRLERVAQETIVPMDGPQSAQCHWCAYRRACRYPHARYAPIKPSRASGICRLAGMAKVRFVRRTACHDEQSDRVLDSNLKFRWRRDEFLL